MKRRLGEWELVKLQMFYRPHLPRRFRWVPDLGHRNWGCCQHKNETRWSCCEGLPFLMTFPRYAFDDTLYAFTLHTLLLLVVFENNFCPNE